MNPRKRDESDELAERRLSPEQAAAAAMVAEARQRGLELTGPDGLLKLFTKNVLETALNEEIAGHLGYEKNQADPGRQSANVRNGARSKTVISDAAGEVRIDVPRDRGGTFEPQIVKKRQRRLTDVDEIVLSLYSKGLTTGEISAQASRPPIRSHQAPTSHSHRVAEPGARVGQSGSLASSLALDSGTWSLWGGRPNSVRSMCSWKRQRLGRVGS
jgi:Transposase, Mutator family